MADGLTDEEILSMEQRLNAALGVIPLPWLPLRETKEGIGGGSFIRGGDGDLDYEIYLQLNLEGQLIGSPNEQLDEVIEYLGRSVDDVRRLISEVRRLRSGS